MTAVNISHIALNDAGTAFIDGTRTRVAMVVMDKMNGLSPEQIHESYPYLSLSQIHAALAYYYDHQPQLDAEIAREASELTQLHQQAINSAAQPTRSQLQARRNKAADRS